MLLHGEAAGAAQEGGSPGPHSKHLRPPLRQPHTVRGQGFVGNFCLKWKSGNKRYDNNEVKLESEISVSIVLDPTLNKAVLRNQVLSILDSESSS